MYIYYCKTVRMPQRCPLSKILVFLTLIILNGSAIALLRLHPIIWISLFLISLMKIILSLNHSLLILLRLEIASICTLMALTLSHTITPCSTFIFTVITLAVCEARFGLSLLIRYARSQGSELLPLYSLKLIKLKTFKVFNAPQIFLV